MSNPIKIFSRLNKVNTITTDNNNLYCTNGSSITRINLSTKLIDDDWNTTLITVKNDFPQKIFYHENKLYATNGKYLKCLNINTPTETPKQVEFTKILYGLIIKPGTTSYIYVSDQENIYRINVEDYLKSDFISTNLIPFIIKKTETIGRDHLEIYEDFLYISTDSNINRYNINTGIIDNNWELTNLPGARGICIYEDIIYILNISNDRLSYFNINSETNTTPRQNPTLTDVYTKKAEDIIVIAGVLYITNTDYNNIIGVDTTTKTYTDERDFCGLSGNTITNNINMVFKNDIIYILNYNNYSIYKLIPTANTITKYNTKDDTGIPTGISYPISMCAGTTNTNLYISNEDKKIYTKDIDFTLPSDMPKQLTVTPYNMVFYNDIIYFTTYSLNSIYYFDGEDAQNLLTEAPLSPFNNCDGITFLSITTTTTIEGQSTSITVNNLYICCSDGIYRFNLSNKLYSRFITVESPSKITTDGTYLYFSVYGKIYKADVNGTYNEILSVDKNINGLLYRNKLYYISDGIIYSYELVPIIKLFNRTVKPGDKDKKILGVNLLNVTSLFFNSNLISSDGYVIDSDNSITIKTIPAGTDSATVYVKALTSETQTLVESNTETYIMPTSYTVCFLAGTLIQTDQGPVRIEEIDTRKHTINKNKIIAITKTIYETDETLVCFEKDSIQKNYPKKQTIISRKHKILNKNIFKEAEEFINNDSIYFIKYNGEILYNVLLEKHFSMRVHNLVCETLHPQNKVALFYRQKIKEGVPLENILIRFKKVT